MQRVLVILAVILLVTASLGVGTLAAHWPFWQRAWAWHTAPAGWPEAMPGPRTTVRGGTGGIVQIHTPQPFAAVARGANTTLLLHLNDGTLSGWHAPGTDFTQHIDGRGLTVAVLRPLFEAMARETPGLLDKPIGAWLPEMQQDARGALTPGALLAAIPEGLAAPPTQRPLNPFRATAKLAAGPDFRGAALALFDKERSSERGAHGAATAQLLAEVAAAAAARPFATVLEEVLWQDLASADASLLLDRRQGAAAAHCCMLATGEDWLRLGLRLAVADAANPGTPASGVRTISTAGRVLLVSGDRALLWVGEGEPPSDLESLLYHAQEAGDDAR